MRINNVDYYKINAHHFQVSIHGFLSTRGIRKASVSCALFFLPFPLAKFIECLGE